MWIKIFIFKSIFINKNSNKLIFEIRKDHYKFIEEYKYKMATMKQVEDIVGFSTEITKISFFQSLIAEFFATAIYIFFTISSTSTFLRPNELTIGLTAGLTAIALITSFGHISGAQMNPAITFALMIMGEISIFRGLCFMTVQSFASILSTWIIKAFLSRDDYIGLLTLRADGINPGKGIFVEIMISLLVIMVYLAVTDNSRSGYKATASIAIGMAITVGHFAGLRFTGAGLNPVRAFGPAVIHNKFKDNYIYWVGPLIGACGAVLIYKFVIQFRTVKVETHNFSEKL